MASTALSASGFAEHPAARAVQLEADVVKPKTPVTEMSPPKTPSPGPRETPASQGMDAAQKDISELSNTQKQHLEQEEGELKGCVTSTQDAAAAVAVMPAGPARCLAGLSAAQQKEDTQESERLLSEGTREPSGNAILNTAGGNLLRSTNAGFPRIAAKRTGSGSRLSDDCGSGRSDSQSTQGYNDEPDVSSSNAGVLRVSVYNEESNALVKTSTFAAAPTMAVDPEAEAPSARKQTQRAQQQNEDDLLTSSLQAVLQHRQNVLEKASREMKEVLDLATQCKDREALAPKIQLLKEQLLAREQQHDAQKRELAATVKALLSTTRCENEDEGAESALRRQIAQREHRNSQHEVKQGSTCCSQTTQKEVVNKDDKQPSMSGETPVYLTDDKQDTEQQQQQQQQQEALPADSYTSAEKRRAPKPACTVGSWHPGSYEKESRAAQESDKEKLSAGESSDKVSPKKELPLAGDTAQKKEAPKTAESSSKEASTCVSAREQKSKLTKEVEQPRQHQSKQQRQATDEEKETARRLRKNGTWWRQQVVNRLRLPGPNLSRKQFLSTFHHPETGVDTALLNAVFDRLKVIVYKDDGVAEEAVTVPHVLDLLEKTNGLNILHTLDAAELLEANVRCIDRKMTSQKTDLQVFAIRLMCRFFLAVSKKTFGELEMTCRRVAPREAVRTYTDELESYRQTLIKAIAAEKNISIDQSTVVVSKCIHNMRTELQNDLVLLQCGPPQPTATQTEHPLIDLAKCRPQSLTVEKPLLSESDGGRPPPTRHAASAASAAPYKLSAAASPLAASSQAATLPSVYPYGAVRRLATPGNPPFAAADFQGHPSAYVSVSSPAPLGGVAAAGAHPAATGVRYAPNGVVSSKGSPVVGTTLNPSAAASNNPPLPGVAPTSRPTGVMSTEGAERHLKGSVSVPKLISARGDHGGKTADSEALGESSRRQARMKGVPSDKDTSGVPEEKSGSSTTKFATVAGAPTGMAAGCTATPAECLNQQQREKDLGNLVQIVEYRYADGTPVTNPAHLPEGAKAVEAAARARLEETARVAQQAARRAEAAALAQFTAATAAGGGGTAAASVAAAQYRRAFAALSSSNQESVHHDGTYPKINGEIGEFTNNPSEPTMHRMTPGMAAPTVVPQEEQQPQQGQQTVWKPQHVLAPTAVGGLLRPLPAAMVAAAAARRPSAPKPPNVDGVVGDTATAEGVATQKGEETNAASLQCVPSIRGRAPGSYVLPQPDRAATLKDPATAADYSAAAGIVPPGFPAGAAGQLQALLQQQRLLTAMPSMVVSGAKLTTAGHDITRTPMPASAATRGTPPTSRTRVSRSLTPNTADRDNFMRRSRGGCMGGSSPYRKSKRSNDSSIRASSVSSIQRAAGRFFASLGLWKSDGEDEEEDTSSSPDAVPQVQDGLAEAAEQYLNGQQQQLQQQQQGQQGLVPQQFALQHQQQKLQQQQLQHQQHQLQQQQHQHQLQPQQPLQQQLQHQRFQQHLQQAMVVSGLGTFPAVLPSRISTASGAPTTELPNPVQGDGAAGRAGMYSMGSGVQLQSLRHYVAVDAAEHTAADPRVYCTENATDKNFFPASSMLSAQQYRLSQQQKQQQDQQRQQHPRPHSGETWISTPSLLMRDVSGNLTAESNVSSQQRATEKNSRGAPAAATPVEKRFTATMESILAEAGEDEKKTAAAPAEKPTGYFASLQQKDYASVQIPGGEQQRDRQQGYTAGTDFTEKKAVTQQLHQNFLQQQRGAVVGGYNQATSRDTSVVTTHISQQTDSPNAMHTLHGLAYTAADRAIQHMEVSQTMTSSSIAGQDAAVSGGALACQQGEATAVPSATLSPTGAGGSSVASAAASASKAHQRSDSSNAAPAAFSSTAAGLGALAASSRMPPQAEMSNTVALSSSAVAAFPPAVVRTRVSSVAEVPSPQLGAQHIGNFAQVQAHLDSLTQRQVEAYAQQYGLYSTPQAAAAALGGVPLMGVGALGGAASCNGYAQFMSQHRPLPPVPPNYVFTKSS